MSARPLVGVLCCNETAERPVQVVASRFIEPLTHISGATVLLVPALVDATDVRTMADLFDGLLLTGSRSHVAPERYGGAPLGAGDRVDRDRDEVALGLAGRMIEHGKPVFGICRGLQEINVLFGGSLSDGPELDGHYLKRDGADYAAQFSHRHDVELIADGRLARATGVRRLSVNSVHEQAIDRLGSGLEVEAVSTGDGIVEAVAARPCGADVLGVQWHPEWDIARCPASRSFFALLGQAVRRGETIAVRRRIG